MNNLLRYLGFVGALMLLTGCNPPPDSTPIPAAPVMNNDPPTAGQESLTEPAAETSEVTSSAAGTPPSDSPPTTPTPDNPSEPADPVWNLIKQRAKFYSQLDPSNENEVKK